jgi:hypothetical protein
VEARTADSVVFRNGVGKALRPIVHQGQDISISHLAPFELMCPCPEVRDLKIDIDFRNHCYTEKFDNTKHERSQIVLYDGPHPRVFCPVRHGLSYKLPAIIKDLPTQRVHQTHERRNYVYVVPLQVDQRIYEVYFMLQRAEPNAPADLRLTVESAYPVAVPHVLPKRPNAIRFVVLARKIFLNQPVRFAAR